VYYYINGNERKDKVSEAFLLVEKYRKKSSTTVFSIDNKKAA